MPPRAADVEGWWLRPGYQAIVQVVDASELPVRSHQCGYAQAVQQRLRAFDHSHELADSLSEAMATLAANGAFARDFNPRKKVHETMRCIFRRPDDGGINGDRALDGLEFLDAMEMHRQRLVSATSSTS
ncbi:hypothetical protein XA68_13056 [Ophiocordyceps unilateralis]|uniref:Uncharacterized protein n=1 Tax=Ophiocordyceps unilateralis TaxID=268505 RepID=A0A2A9PDC3_OPHUN|nr:hypothetical protein XA68_13056 [Ophiocordyceps unilateralis]